MYPQNDLYTSKTTVSAAQASADAIVLTCGFKPRRITCYNATTGLRAEWYEGMTETGGGLKTVTAGDLTTTTSISVTERTFTLGADIVNAENDVIYAAAYR